MCLGKALLRGWVDEVPVERAVQDHKSYALSAALENDEASGRHLELIRTLS